VGIPIVVKKEKGWERERDSSSVIYDGSVPGGELSSQSREAYRSEPSADKG